MAWNPPVPIASTSANAPRARRKRPLLRCSSTRVVSPGVDGEASERQLNIHLDPEHLGGVYANFANVSFSDYEFTLTFARIDHEVEEGDIPGVVVSRINMSSKFTRALIDAPEDSWSKW